uniref:Uncharacterized protein n=1 Tax=Vitis vinifera TaxID=29760 RepID=A5AGN6_VITVI|nr:hypothetical protein VITISV_019660 [Vitis vinifera]
MKALQKNITWKIIDLPGGKRSVASKWVFTVKKPFIDRVSFWSPSPSPKVFWSTVSSSENPHHRQKTLTVGHFSGEVFFRYRPYHQVRKEEIFKFCQSTGGRISVTHRPRAFLLQRLEPHAPTREGTSSTFRQRASTSSLA